MTETLYITFLLTSVVVIAGWINGNTEIGKYERELHRELNERFKKNV